MSKGSAPRPYSVKDDVFAEHFCNTFGHRAKHGRCMNCGITLPPNGEASNEDVSDGE